MQVDRSHKIQYELVFGLSYQVLHTPWGSHLDKWENRNKGKKLLAMLTHLFLRQHHPMLTAK